MPHCPTDQVEFHRPRHLPGLELVRATYKVRSFPTHSHAEYVIGAVVAGAERLTVSGQEMIVRAGSSLCLHPDEPHSNASIDRGGMSYRVLYIPTNLIPPELGLSFSSPVSSCKTFFQHVVQVHRTLATSDDLLEQEQAFLSLLHALPNSQGSGLQDRHVHAGVAAARAYLERHFCEKAGMAELATVAGLSPFHMIRSFRRQYGLAPAAFRNQLRVMEARRLLQNGEKIADVAISVGFADQSHLTRLFQRILGTTPGIYAQQ